MKALALIFAFFIITAADSIVANEKASNENGYEFGKVSSSVDVTGGNTATSAGNNVYISLGDGAIAADLTIEQLNSGEISSSAY